MFSIEKKEENGFDKIFLRDGSSSTYAEIIPRCGAILNAFVVRNNGEELNVVKGYSSIEDFRNNFLNTFYGSKLSPFVCRISNGEYQFGEKTYKLESFYFGKNAIHGKLADRQFNISGETANEFHASVTLKHEYRKADKGYPFSYDCIVTWQLEKENVLTVTTECINKDEGLIPMQDGWHPYFTLGDKINNLQLEFQSKEMVEFNEELVPTKRLISYHKFNSVTKIGTTSFDNCFTLAMGDCQPLCVLRNPEKGIEVEIHPGKSYPYLQIYTPDDRQSIAIENLSGAPNAFNNGMGFITLQPGESALFQTSYKITNLT